MKVPSVLGILLPFLLPSYGENFALKPKNESNLEIINGQEAQPHAYPYMAKLYIVFVGGYNNMQTLECGGSLISRNYVLTAAHCTYMNSYWIHHARVVLGAHDVSYAEAGSLRLDSATIRSHPYFNRQTLDFDIALIKLPYSITPNRYIQIISLPRMSNAYANYAGQYATLSGWGQTSSYNRILPNRLRVVQIPIVQEDVCYRVFHQSMAYKICSGGSAPNSGGCQGDSGGPLVVGGVQVGMVSYGYNICDTSYAPGVFTRVDSYLQWIASNSDVTVY